MLHCAGTAHSTTAMQAISTDLVTYIEVNTRQQADSELWRHLHDGRITSSVFGDVFKSGRQANSLIQRILHNKYSRLHYMHYVNVPTLNLKVI